MPASEPSSATLEALSDREREILGLLTAGHTVKTIALRLGRSEASINERLRDARRKTGVGSSRELARLLAAQKIWDKKIDLPSREIANEGLPHPRIRGHLRPKGTFVMLATLTLVAAGLVMIAAEHAQDGPQPQAAHSAEAAPSPLVGTWSVDVDRIPAEERPRQVTMDFDVDSNQVWTSVVEITGVDGSVTRGKSTARLDGGPAPITGNMHFIDTVSLRQPAPNTLVMTLGKDGAPVSTRVYTVAKDRRTMTETIVWAGNRMPKMVTNHFTRVE